MAEKKNVRIRLFKDNSRYKGDLFVSVNGDAAKRAAYSEILDSA